MWAADRVVALTPGSAITIPEIANEFAIKGNHLTLVKGNQFEGRTKTDPQKHIHEFFGIYDMFKYRDTENEAIRLMMFPLSLTGEAKTWLDELNEGTIKTWDEPQTAFISRFFPPALFDRLLREIRAFSQHENEALTDAWLLLNVAAGGIFLYKTPNQAYQLLKDKVLLKLDWAKKQKSKSSLKKTIAFADEVIRVKQKQLNLGVGTDRMTFNIDSAIKHSYSNDDTCFSINVIDEILEEDFEDLLNEGSKILHSVEGTVLEEEIFSKFDKFIAMTADENYDSKFDTKEPPFEKIIISTDYKIKTSLEEPPTDLELKPIPVNLEYVFLEEPSFLPVIISSQLSTQNKSKLVSVLKKIRKHFPGKQQISLVSAHLSKEIVKLLDTDIIYPIADSPWASSIHCVTKKGGITVVTNENDELVPTRTVTGWRCMTRSSTKELLSPFENPIQKFRSRRRLFDTPSLLESNSQEFDHNFKIEENSEEEGQFLKELRDNTFSGSEHEDANEHIEKMSKVLQERGFRSLSSSTKTYPQDQVKSISTAKADFSEIHQAQDVKILDAYDHTLPQKEKDPGSFTLPCFIHNICFDKALVDLGASVSVMPFSTYTNFGLGILSHTRLTIELADRTIKQPRGIAKNVLVRIGKFIFPIDFIILDIPEDDDVPLILKRPFLSTAISRLMSSKGRLL
ncbi:reverse transcriptase domain-containing protein [Tanacetum coccineum]